MPQEVQVGTILIEETPAIARALGLLSVPFSANWAMVKALDGLALDRKINSAGWSFFFIAAEVKVMFFGTIGANIQKAVQRILSKVKPLNFNCLQVTGIVAKRFIGVPYTVISAHSRHIQEGYCLDTAEGRRNSRHDAIPSSV